LVRVPATVYGRQSQRNPLMSDHFPRSRR
jgi:hypothetical protein